MTVLYVIACGSSVARDVGRLISLGQQKNFNICLVPTEAGRQFIDIHAMAELTGNPVRSTFKQPGEPDLLPLPDAIIVAPATVNTINKWAAGAADTLALALLIEAYGLGVPIVAMPYTNSAMARHPAFQESLVRLESWGVRVLYGDDVVKLHAPRAAHQAEFPWHLALEALER